MAGAARFSALLLDLGGVVVFWESNPEMDAWLRRLGRTAGWFEGWLWSRPWARPLLLGQLTEAEFWQRVGESLGLTADESAALGASYFHSYRLNGPMMDLVRQARASGIRTGICSNAFRDLAQFLRDARLQELFDAVVSSALVGITKPDPRIYHLSCARLGVAPEQTLFIDDARRNVQGAQRAGMLALQYVDESTVAAAAQLLNLPWP